MGECGGLSECWERGIVYCTVLEGLLTISDLL
jgi:hypothetical protein